MTKKPKDPAVYVEDMLIENHFIEEALSVGSLYDATMSRAILRSFTVLGEAVKRIDNTTRKKALDIPWQKIIDVRNLLSHDYEEINLQKIEEIVDNHLPSLKKELLVLYTTLTGNDYYAH